MIAHRCPICLGQQTVEQGYYDAKNDGGCLSWPATTTGEREMCRTCMGRGMVWEPDLLLAPNPFAPYVPPISTTGDTQWGAR